MSPVNLQGPTLGHKHRNYNQIIKESISNQTTDALKDIDFNEDDVSNLVKVDMASVNRNVDYILGILKGNDMLYVSRAIARCPWLITDSTYAHIINPEYLHSHLLPNMMAKAGNKLMLHIRLNLRDETRVESFFNYYEHLDLKTALKWLPHCSAAFTEVKVKKYCDDITPHLLKRLCEKSHCMLEILVKSNAAGRYLSEEFQETMFLLATHTHFYLDLIEPRDSYEYPKFNAKCTKFLMKACPERVHRNFCKYGNKIHIPTFVKFLDGNKVKEFLLTQANIDETEFDSWMCFSNLQHFLKIMPQEERINFIRDIFVNKSFTQDKQGSENRDISEDEDEDSAKKDERAGMARIYKFGKDYRTSELLYWHECLPFDIALTEVKEKLKNNTDEYELNNMLQSLAGIVNSDMRHLETLLQYYNDNHLKDSSSSKCRFVNNLFDPPTNVLRYDVNCWSLLTNILNTINIDDESKPRNYNEDQIWVQTVIVHEVINRKEIPENIVKRFHYSTLKEYQKKMNTEERTLLFDYLYNYLVTEIEQNICINQEEDNFHNYVGLIQLMLNLLNDWSKNLADYTYVLDKIKQLIKLKQDKSSKVNLAWIYNVNKTWRKCMFEESIILCESDRVCVNALKHDASLLSRNEELLATMRCNDAVPLRQLFIKVKVYWADSYACEWSQSYREKLAQPLGHKAIMRGLSRLLPQRELSDIINAYKPEDAIINWEKDDEVLISLRKHIAKNMHFARPQPTPDNILQYAKGDYLQFALPSLNAIFYNLPASHFQELIPKLLNSPVSLQKHVIRLAFTKMQSEDLQQIFCNHWKTIKNLSIRAVLFKLTYELLCKQKNPAKVGNIWDLLKLFIDELSFEEDKTIYEHLGQVQKVPLSVRPLYVMRSYTFLKALLPKTDIDKNKYEQSLESLIHEMNSLIESMEPELIANILQEYIAAVYTQEETEGFVHKDLMPLLASFLFSAASEEVQAQRYEKVLLPLLKHTVAVWAGKDKNDTVKTNFRRLLTILRQNLKYDANEYKIIPVAMFSAIQKELEQSLDHNVSYLLLTEWKLTTAFVKVVNDTKGTVDRSNHVEGDTYWAELSSKAVPLFGKMCLEFLREDIKTFFPCIDEYFSKALGTFFDGLINSDHQIQILKRMLTEDLTQSYLVAIRALSNCWGCSEDAKVELQKTILSHPSLEVKMHFYHKNKDYRNRDLN